MKSCVSYLCSRSDTLRVKDVWAVDKIWFLSMQFLVIAVSFDKLKQSTKVRNYRGIATKIGVVRPSQPGLPNTQSLL